RQLVDDPPLLGIDDAEEVRRLDARPLVQAGEVEVLLRRRLHRLCGRGVEASGAVVIGVVVCAHAIPSPGSTITANLSPGGGARASPWRAGKRARPRAARRPRPA